MMTHCPQCFLDGALSKLKKGLCRFHGKPAELQAESRNERSVANCPACRWPAVVFYLSDRIAGGICRACYLELKRTGQIESFQPRAEPSAGDLLIRAVDQWAEHCRSCQLAVEECGKCDALLNQVLVAHNVWSSSAHKLPSLHGSKVRDWPRPVAAPAAEVAE